MLIEIGSSSGYHNHEHVHHRDDPNDPGNKLGRDPNSNTDHHNPYHHFGGRSGTYTHENPHKHLPEQQHNIGEGEDTDRPVQKYYFEEEWFRNPLDYTENALGSQGDDVNVDFAWT